MDSTELKRTDSTINNNVDEATAQVETPVPPVDEAAAQVETPSPPAEQPMKQLNKNLEMRL